MSNFLNTWSHYGKQLNYLLNIGDFMVRYLRRLMLLSALGKEILDHITITRKGNIPYKHQIRALP